LLHIGDERKQETYAAKQADICSQSSRDGIVISGLWTSTRGRCPTPCVLMCRTNTVTSVLFFAH